MPDNGIIDRPARYWTDAEIACVVFFVRKGLLLVRSPGQQDYPAEQRMVSLVRQGARAEDLMRLPMPRLDAELTLMVVAAMAGHERAS